MDNNKSSVGMTGIQINARMGAAFLIAGSIVFFGFSAITKESDPGPKLAVTTKAFGVIGAPAAQNLHGMNKRLALGQELDTFAEFLRRVGAPMIPRLSVMIRELEPAHKLTNVVMASSRTTLKKGTTRREPQGGQGDQSGLLNRW